MSTESNTEHRNYFRVEDEVIIRVAPCSEEAAFNGTIPSEFHEDDDFSLVNELQRIDHDNQQLLNQFAHQYRELELYLRGLNKKIDLIASQLVKSKQHNKSKQVVTLSEGGIRFHSHQSFTKDRIIAIQLFLLPSYVSVILFGRVINCTSAGNGYSISTMFIGLSDTNRQILARQIMQVQLAAKRQQSDF